MNPLKSAVKNEGWSFIILPKQWKLDYLFLQIDPIQPKGNGSFNLVDLPHPHAMRLLSIHFSEDFPHLENVLPPVYLPLSLYTHLSLFQLPSSPVSMACYFCLQFFCLTTLSTFPIGAPFPTSLVNFIYTFPAI